MTAAQKKTTKATEADDVDVFDVDVYVNELDLRPYRFRMGGKLYELPHASTLTAQQAVDLTIDPLTTLSQVAGDDLAPKLMALPTAGLEAIVKRWTNAAGVDAGE
jgi:hypothetical protein